MKNKAFKLGIIVGRFQTFHTGHLYMVDKACAVCDRVGVFVGSSQESGTLKNPFTYEEREYIIKKVFGGAVEVCPLPDAGIGNVPAWGEHVLAEAAARFGEVPDLFVSGKESRRADWFDGENGAHVAELYIPKTIDVSASRMRALMLAGERESWLSLAPAELADDFDRLRAIVFASRANLETSSI